MSQEKSTAPQVEEPVADEATAATAAAGADTAAVQPEQVAEKVADEAAKVAEPAQEANDKVTDKSAEAEGDKQEAGDEKAAENVKKPEEVQPEVEAADGAEAKVLDEKVDESKEEVSKETNGQKVEAVAAGDETNGVCKRKAENGAEVADEEKTPKKAKVVDDVEQAPVEETAA